MKKQEFMERLEYNLSSLTEFQRRDVLSEYSRFIDEKIQMGYQEDDVVAGFGSVDALSLKILRSFGIDTLPMRNTPPLQVNRPRNKSAKWIVLIISIVLLFIFAVVAILGVVTYSILDGDDEYLPEYLNYHIDSDVKTIEINQYAEDVYFYCDPELDSNEIMFKGDNLDIDYYDLDGSMMFWVITDSDTLTVTYGEGLEGMIEGLEYDYY